MPQPPARRAATIYDVAAEAGVSAMTVSNVMNGRSSMREDTRQRVLAAIAKLNYRPASSGRNLRLGRRYTICVVVVDVIRDSLSRPFTSYLLSGLCEALNDQGYVVMVQGIRFDDFEQAFPLRQTGADAYCVKLTGNVEQRTAMLNMLERVHEPVILVHETLPMLSEDRMTIRQDDFGGARQMAEHLRTCGVNSAVLLTPQNHGPMTNARIAGFRAGLPDLDIPAVPAHSNSFKGGFSAIGKFLEAGNLPEAIICTNDEFAAAALRAAQDRGLSVPRDIMITGFNGFKAEEYFNPSLTTVVSRTTDIGAEAARLLMGRLAGQPFEMRDYVLPVFLRKGQSTR